MIVLPKYRDAIFARDMGSLEAQLKESTCNAAEPGSIPGLGRSPGEGNGYPLQYSGLENSTWRHKELDMTEQFSLSSLSLFFV